MKLTKVRVASSCLLLLLTTAASIAQAANPFGLAYRYTTNAQLYGKPTGILIAGRCNLYNSVFADARKKGAEVLAYINAVDRPDHRVCAVDQKFYMNDYGRVPLWPFPTYGQRGIWPNMRMTDMRPGSKWILHVVNFIEGMMREDKVDGVFLDVVGARPWSKGSAWSTWSQAEKNAWTDGNIDLVRRLDARRRAVNPDFIIVGNSVWDRGDSRGFPGERYVDGIVLEHPRAGSPWHIKYVAKPFGNLGHRRVLVIGNNAAEALGWAKVKGVTHVSSQSHYGTPTTPPVPFNVLNDR